MTNKTPLQIIPMLPSMSVPEIQRAEAGANSAIRHKEFTLFPRAHFTKLLGAIKTEAARRRAA